MTNLPSLDGDEKEAMQSLYDFMAKMNSWGLAKNVEEYIGAVHVLQSFVVQHMLHRINPSDWSDWYTDSPKKAEYQPIPVNSVGD